MLCIHIYIILNEILKNEEKNMIQAQCSNSILDRNNEHFSLNHLPQFDMFYADEMDQTKEI